MGLVSATNTAAESFDADIREYVVSALMNAERFIVVADLLAWSDLSTDLDLDSQRAMVSRVERVAREATCVCSACHGEGFVAESVRYDDSPALLGEVECDHCDGSGILNARGNEFDGRVVWNHEALAAVAQNDSDADLDVAAE